MSAEHGSRKRSRSLDRYFRSRMAPLALGAGVVLALAIPGMYRGVAWQKLTTQGTVYAEQIGLALSEVALSQQTLWRYNAPKITRATLTLQSQTDVLGIEVFDCGGQSLFRSGAPSARGPAGWGTIRVQDQILGQVQVSMDASDEHKILILIAAQAAGAGLVLALFLYFFPVGVVKRQARRLEGAVSELKTARAELQTTNDRLEERIAEATGQVRELSLQAIEAQEKERQRIARDLHDSLGQSITGLQMDAEVAIADPQQSPTRLARVIEGTKQALHELRQIVHHLNPPQIRDGSLVDALTAQAESFEARSGVRTYFRSRSVPDCSLQVASTLYRVQQEALTNVQRHARAEEVAMTLEFGDPVRFEIADDGQGFQPDEEHRGAGLRGMRERVELLGGTIGIKSEPGVGTRVTIVLPSGVKRA